MTANAWARVLATAGIVLLLVGCRPEAERARQAARRSAEDTAKGDAAALAAYDSSIRATPVPDSLAGRARAEANDLDSALYAELFARLDAGGPARGIAVCADTAESRSARWFRSGTFVRRMTLRPRDAANLADSAGRVAIARLAGMRAQGRAVGGEAHFFMGEDGQQRVEYVRPIVAGQRCQLCHAPAADLTPAVRGLLAQRWPTDSSPGYRPGELMGAVVVRFIVRRPSAGH